MFVCLFPSLRQFRISSDIWSLGLSLLELALGRYPIPVLPRNEIENLMSLPEGTPATSGREEIRQAIFELLSEIIDQDPPKVPSDYFSQEFCAFIDMCLQVTTLGVGENDQCIFSVSEIFKITL